MNSFASKLFHLSLSVVLCLFSPSLPNAYARSCPWPCVPDIHCRGIDLSVCQYGSVIDTCYCCNVCGLGPDVLCGKLEGNCGDGMECVQDIPPELLPRLSTSDRTSYPGQCKNASSEVTTTEKNPTEMTTAVPTTATTGTTTTTTTTAAATSQSSTTKQAPTVLTASTTTSLPECRPQCSVETCGPHPKNKICSAKGMTFSQVEGRDHCQHTTCLACFVFPEPNCSHLTCPDPPNKSCLRRYSNCINLNFWSASLTQLSGDGDSLRGPIKCFVPDMNTT